MMPSMPSILVSKPPWPWRKFIQTPRLRCWMASCTMWPQMFWRLEAHKVGRFHYGTWWLTYPSWDYYYYCWDYYWKMIWSVGIMTFPIWWEKYKIHVPNHQSDYVKCPFLEPVLSTSSLSRVVFQVSHNSSQENTRWTLPTLPTICENRGPFNRRVWIQNWVWVKIRYHKIMDG